jgi:hypothetical protein
MGNECDIATQIILENKGEGQSMVPVAENRFENKVHSLGNCEQQDWKSNNLILSQNVNGGKSLIERDVSQFEIGDFKNDRHWDLENPGMDLDDPNSGGFYGELPQRLDTEQCTNMPRFGFIPLQHNEVTQGPENQQFTAQQLWGKKQANDIDVHNYNSYRVPVQSGFKVDRFQELAEDYDDKQLFELLRFGFPLDMTQKFYPVKDTINHTSAVKFLEVKKFIMTELQQGALSGPIHSDEFANIHISPQMLPPKEGDTRRIIVDLLWPKTEGASVNDAVLENKYLNCDFILKLPMVDHICQIINAFEVPVLIYKIDLAHAFRQIPIDPLDIVNLGIEWEGNIYI